MVKQKRFAVFVLVVWPRCCWWGWAAVYRWEDAARRMGVDMRGAQPTPGNDAELGAGMVAGGAQIVAFTTGRGAPPGCPSAPVIKIATNSGLARGMADDLDLDAGTVISAGEPLEAVGACILAEVIAVASGPETAAERWGRVCDQRDQAAGATYCEQG